MKEKKGFIFNQELCVNCKACSAACSLENGFPVNVRTIFTFNAGGIYELPLYHLSSSCNHCAEPVCMYGCPSSAYSRDTNTDAIIIESGKCIGCSYCVWNCPYDAPHYDSFSGTVSKCHLCYSRLNEGFNPACTDACPTGALGFGLLSSDDITEKPSWFPDIGLDPSVQLNNFSSASPLKIIPKPQIQNFRNTSEYKKTDIKELSLILFSFSATLSVSVLFADLVSGDQFGKMTLLILSLIPGFFSLFHLGRPWRAWRAISNIRRSALSREIFFYLLYVLMNSVIFLVPTPLLSLITALTGLVLLVSVDSVYYYTTRNIRSFLHSGQTFLSALLISSFLSGSVYPFIFIAAIKVALTVSNYYHAEHNTVTDALRFIRTAFILISSAGVISGISYPGVVLLIIMLTGEFADRLLFYHDFNPLSLGWSIKQKTGS